MSRSADFRSWATKTDERAAVESATFAERAASCTFGCADNVHRSSSRGCAAGRDKPGAARFDSWVNAAAG